MPFRVFEKTVEVNVASGQQESAEVLVDCLTVGAIHKVAAKQTEGASVGFTVYIMGKAGATNVDGYLLNSVIPPLSVSSGQVGTYFSDHGHPYARFDAPLSHSGLVIRVRTASAVSQDSKFTVVLLLRTADG